MQSREHNIGLLSIQGQTLLLHPDKAIFWEEKSRLLLADVHLGKAGHFRKAGIPVPQAVAQQSLSQLAGLIEVFLPQEVWVLGDLFHSLHNYEWPLWSEFVQSQSEIKFSLIPGNHDRFISTKKQNPYEMLGKEVEDSPFVFTHEPLQEPHPSLVNVFGHIHPAIVLKGKGRQSLRLPCFWVRDRQVVLPAFGPFTGMHTIQPSSQDKIFAICEGQVIAVHG